MPLLPNRTILAIGAVVDIAMYSGKEPVRALDLVDRLQLPRRCLDHVLQALVREGILRGRRGPLGGYRLAKAQQAISVHNISEAVRTIEPEEPSEELSGLLEAVVMPALTPAERSFASTLRRMTVEDLVQAASLQMLVSYKPDAIAN